MEDALWEIHGILNKVKGFRVCYAPAEKKLLVEYEGKRFVAEFREIENPSESIIDDMKRIKYL